MVIEDIVNQALQDAGLPEDDPIADITRTVANVIGAAFAQWKSRPPPAREAPTRGSDEYDHEHRIPHFRSR